jgi:anti-sigma factor RsiW
MTTKLVVHNRARMIATPGAVSTSLKAMVEAEAARTPDTEPGWWAVLASRPLLKPALGLGLVAATVVVIIRSVPEQDSPPGIAEDDVISQSFANYRAVLAGTIAPQVLSERPDQVQAFFAGKTGFPVMVPRIRSCTLIGGVLNEFSGAPLAHVVYRRNDDIVYMYQACWQTVQRGTPLRLPDTVRTALLRTGWYTASRPDGSSIAVWASGETLCAAVARMSTNDLLTCLETRSDPAP